VQHVAVLGGNELGIGIAALALAHGDHVSLWDADGGALDTARERVEAELALLAESGSLDAPARRAALDALTLTHSLASLSKVDVAIDAPGPESGKAPLLSKLGALLPAQTIIATSTATGSITALAAPIPHPNRVIGIHFFIPVLASAVVEIIPGLRTADWATDRAAELARTWGKTPVKSRNRPGFIVGRVSLPFASEAIEILDDGVATAGTIDALVEALGFRAGPLAHLDALGLDVYHASCKALYDATFGEARYRPSTLVAEMLEAGLLGRVSGEGFYDYRPE